MAERKLHPLTLGPGSQSCLCCGKRSRPLWASPAAVAPRPANSQAHGAAMPLYSLRLRPVLCHGDAAQGLRQQTRTAVSKPSSS